MKKTRTHRVITMNGYHYSFSEPLYKIRTRDQSRIGDIDNALRDREDCIKNMALTEKGLGGL